MKYLIATMAIAVVACTPPTQLQDAPFEAAEVESTTTLAFERSAPEDEAEVYVTFLRAWSADVPYITLIDTADDDELVHLGLLVCASYDAGMTDSQLAIVLMDTFEAYDPRHTDDAAVIAGAALGIFCPEH